MTTPMGSGRRRTGMAKPADAYDEFWNGTACDDGCPPWCECGCDVDCPGYFPEEVLALFEEPDTEVRGE